MDKFKFLQWPMYKESRNLFSYVLRLVQKMPKEYRFELGSQIIRSALSISLNIAEGSGKNSKKDFARFLDIAHGSLYETLAAIDVFRYNELIDEKEFTRALDMLYSIENQITGFKRTLTS